MNSNKFFSFSRFYQLLRNDILINYKKYFLTIVGGFILGLLIIYMAMPHQSHDGVYSGFNADAYSRIFFLCLFGLAAFVGLSFPEMSSKVKISNYLLIPSSTFEKFLSQIFIRMLAGTVIFLFVFWVDSHLARLITINEMIVANPQLKLSYAGEIIQPFRYSMLTIKNSLPPITYYKLFEGLAMIFWIFSLGIYLFSIKLFFRKTGLIKTMLSLSGVILIVYLLCVFFSHLFYPETVGFNIGDIDYKLSNGYSNGDIFLYSIAYLAPLFLIPLGYFKLKEKQL